jgi:hypothetical protein
MHVVEAFAPHGGVAAPGASRQRHGHDDARIMRKIEAVIHGPRLR